MTQPGIRLLAVGPGGFHQAVELGAGGRAFGRVAEQPVFAADDEGPDGPLGGVVIDRQVAGLDIAFEPAPVAR
ncbi:hypothetical protein D3C72_2471680 [compost metagenome]